MIYNPARQLMQMSESDRVLRRDWIRMTKREFLTASIGTGLALAEGSAALAQQASLANREKGLQSGNVQRVASRMARTTKLFKSPPGFPNGICCHPGGAVDRRAKGVVGRKPPLITCRSRNPSPKRPGWSIGAASC